MVKKTQTGAAGLLVLLATIVVLTIAVALASRTASEIAISTKEEESSRAFELAETALERVLSLGTLTGDSDTTSVGDYSVKVEDQHKFTSSLLGVGDTIEVNVNPGSGGKFKLAWNTNKGCNGSALVVALLNSSGTSVKRHAYDPCFGRRTSNNFDDVPSGTILTGGASLARIKVLYHPTTITVSNVPAQGSVVTSTAQTPDGQTRAVEVIQGKPMAPSIFDYAVYSEGIVQNSE